MIEIAHDGVIRVLDDMTAKYSPMETPLYLTHLRL